MKNKIKVKEASVLLVLKTKHPDFWRKWYGVALDYYSLQKSSKQSTSETKPPAKN